jgi:outer membrane protein assembly factor BamB
MSCTSKKSDVMWTIDFPVIGSQSSPRTTDLNNDGVLDIVIGAGKNEFQYSDMGILAINGANGEIIWQHESEDQVYGSATFIDINDDNVQDVVIGGRTPQLRALDGRSGKLIWKYDYKYEDHPILRYAKFNFNNSVLVPDQNSDGIPDILTVNGGNAEAQPFEDDKRFPGVLMLIDAKSGEIIASDTMPDGKESYMSPIAFNRSDSNEQFIIFGSGGETISGNLYLGTLEDLKNQKLFQSKVIASEIGHGFISPPVLADINLDGILDIIAISHASTLFAIDGKTQDLLWSNKIEGTECSNSFAVGYFNKDKIPDFFTFVSKGIWPENTGSLQVMVNGKDGNVEFLDSLGCTGFSSPIAYDLNHDGIDEVLISINEFDCNRKITDQSYFPIENKLLAIDFKSRKVWPIDQSNNMKNVFSTPWIGDLDGDGYLDLIHCQYFSHSDILSFLGMRVKRIDTSVKIRKKITWGAYMGSKGDGIFEGRK